MALEELKSSADEIKQVVDGKVDLFIKEMYGIVSAGGEGVRLRPHTLERPKPMLEIGSSKQPLMYWSMLPMILGGVSRFVVGVRYGATEIMKRFGRGEELSERFGRKIVIDYIEEPEPLGRAGCIKYGLERGIIDPNRPAIIFNGSDILKLNLQELIRHYLWLKACHSFEVVQVYTAGFRVQYGIGRVDPSTSQVVDFVEKPLRSDLANTACYITHGRLRDFKHINMTPSNPEDELIYKWLKERTIGAYIIPFENMISIKFAKDLDAVDEMDLDQYIRSVCR